MRITISMIVLTFAVAVVAPVWAQDQFLKACMKTMRQNTCECISSRMPADKRQAATEALAKSDAAEAPGGNMLDPSKFTKEQMQGLDAVILAQSYCP